MEDNVTFLSNQVLPLEECEDLASHGLNVTSLNVTCLPHAPVFNQAAMVKTIVLTMMAFLSFVGNVATMISIQRTQKRSRSSVYSLIYHLSIADLCVTFFCLTGEAVWSYTVAWKAGDAVCKGLKYFQMFSLYLSTFVLVLVGADRFVAVRYPMKCITSKRCDRLISLVWILSALLSIPQGVIFRVARGPFYEEFYQCVTYGFYKELWHEQLYTTFTLACMFVLPLLILIATYVCTFWTIAKNEEMFKTEVTPNSHFIPADFNRRKIMRKAKMKSLRISVVIVLAFIICWTPYYFTMIIFMFLDPDEHLSKDLEMGIFFFGMSNSVVNPVIYGAFHLWRPRRRANSCISRRTRDGSSRRTFLTSLSFRRRPNSKRGKGSPIKADETSLVVMEEDGTPKGAGPTFRGRCPSLRNGKAEDLGLHKQQKLRESNGTSGHLDPNINGVDTKCPYPVSESAEKNGTAHETFSAL